MEFICKKLSAWFASKGGVYHVIAGLFGFAVLAYAQHGAFTDLVNQIYALLPSWAHEAILAAAGLVALYKNTSKGSDADASSIVINNTTTKTLLALLVVGGLLAFPSTVCAQTTATALPSNIYAVGASYNPGATHPVAGTALYAKLASSDTDTYGFTALDVLPVSTKPFTVSTNVSVGVAQKVLTFESIKFYVPTSAGISITGSNTGWAWTGGVLADYPIKKSGAATQFHLLPNVRYLKSSVSNGSDYQLTGGILVGWGK